VQAKGLWDALEQNKFYPGENVFITFNPLKRRPVQGRGNGDDVGPVCAVFLDIDLAMDGQYANAKNPALTQEQIKRQLTEWGLPEPTAIVNSGNGAHFEYRLDKPFHITNALDRERALSVLKGFNGYVINQAAKLGWKIDSMGDLARVKQAAGSTNLKDGTNPKPVEVIELYPERTYSIEFLEAFKAPVPEVGPAKRVRRTPVNEGARKPEWDSVVAGCLFAQHVEADAP
jgi:hypothetical protein